jgi:hypothetical protein
MEVSGNKINTQIPIKFLFEIVIIFEYAGIVEGCSIKARLLGACNRSPGSKLAPKKKSHNYC